MTIFPAVIKLNRNYPSEPFTHADSSQAMLFTHTDSVQDYYFDKWIKSTTNALLQYNGTYFGYSFQGLRSSGWK